MKNSSSADNNRPTINLENFRFVPFKSKSEDCRNITRKKHLLNITIKEVYPPEGHLLLSGGVGKEIIFSSDESEASGDEVDSGVSESMYNCYVTVRGINMAIC